MGAVNKVWVLAIWMFSCHAAAAERYRAAVVDGDSLRIGTDDGRSFVAAAEPDLADIGSPVGFSQIRLAPDRRSVGWLVTYPNCCTSYPIPLTLVVYADGVRRAYRGSGLPIAQWRFLAGGTQIAFQQEATHGGIGLRYELRDTYTGKQIEAFDWPVGPDNQRIADAVPPDWTHSLAIFVPEAFIGQWNSTDANCPDFATEGTLEITDSSVALYAAGGPIRALKSPSKDALAVQVAFYGEDGQRREEWMHLRLAADDSQLRREDVGIDYFRCKPAP